MLLLVVVLVEVEVGDERIHATQLSYWLLQELKLACVEDQGTVQQIYNILPYTLSHMLLRFDKTQDKIDD